MSEENKYKYYESLTELLKESEKLFEHNMTYMAAGALVLSVSFIGRKGDTDYVDVFFLKLSWYLFVFTLLINLISHRVSIYFITKTMKDEVDKKINDDQKIKKNTRTNKIINRLNNLTLLSLILGVTFLVYFCSLNI